MIIALLFLILFAILFPKALRFLFALLFLGGIVLLGEVHAASPDRHSSLRIAEKWCNTHPDARESGASDEHLITIHDCATRILSCSTIIDSGFAHMPDVADYVLNKPNSDKLGYGSECHIKSLIFAQCFVEPKWSVEEAINVLINKAVAGTPLPNTPVCGA